MVVHMLNSINNLNAINKIKYPKEFIRFAKIIHSNFPPYRCSNPSFFGCERTGSIPMIINPIRSAKIRTLDSFSFKYGKVEISAKMPTGDWLIPGTHLQRFFFVSKSFQLFVVFFPKLQQFHFCRRIMHTVHGHHQAK